LAIFPYLQFLAIYCYKEYTGETFNHTPLEVLVSTVNFSKVDGGFQAQQVVEGAVPAQLLVELAGKFYADRQEDRALARDMFGQMLQLGLAALEMARAEAAERAEERAERQRAERRERQEERQRNERNARRN